MSETITRWWWVRHAPVPGPDGLIKGRLDLPADTSDTAAFATLAAYLPESAIVVTSSRLRCRQTLVALVEAGYAAQPPVVEPNFDEQDFGALQGHTWNELAGDPSLADFWTDPASQAPPGGESFAAMVPRVRAGIEQIGARHAGRDIVAVAHAGTIRCALAAALGISPASALQFAIGTLSLTRIDAVGAAWRVLGVNWSPSD